MNRLAQFKSKAITSKESDAVKGGIRFVTTDYAECMAQIQELQEDGIAFTGEKVWCPVAQEITYCIEW